MSDTIVKDEIVQEPVDAVIDVEIETGGISARIFAHPPLNDGAEISVNSIMVALESKKVTYGINKKLITAVVLEKKYNEWITVATCKPSLDGKNGSIEFLFNQTEDNKPVEDAKGYVNYKDIGTVRNIIKGTVVANITKETEGEEGTNVRGEVIVPKKGMPPKVTFGENIGYSEDGLQLVVQADGNLVFRSGRFSVEQVFRLDGDVDLSTGNIDFIGEVIIRGDVREGFSVKSRKNVTIQGGVFDAVIESGGDIVIKKGSIGSKINAEGKVEVEFAENSDINCKQQLKTKSLYFCNAFCKGEINCSMGNGSIVGGKTTGTNNISAQTIGSKSYTITSLVVGGNAILLEEKNEIIKELEKTKEEIDSCQKIIEFLNAKFRVLGKLPVEKLEILKSATNTIILKKDDIVKKNKRIEQIDIILQSKQNLFVSCRKDLYTGTKIIINDQIFNVDTDYQHCNVGLGPDGIVVTNL